MRYQTKEWYCGPAAVQSCLAILGERISQDTLAAAGGTTEEHGTDEDGVKRMVLSLGRGCDQFESDTAAAAYGWLWLNCSLGRPAVLCVDQWSHWVAAIGLIGSRIVLFDPARYRQNTDRLGTFSLPRDRLLRRWLAAHRVARTQPAYCGIAIGDRQYE